MKALQVLCIALVFGGAVGVIMPGGPLDASGAALSAPDGADRGEQVALAAASSGWGEDLTLPRQADGHFYAAVTIDGQPYPMLVDTGASMVALTGDDALAMNLDWDPGHLDVVAQGASGPVEGVHTRIPEMQVGDHEARDVDAVIIPEGLGVSLLGQSFLSTVGRVEISGDSMILKASE